MKTCRVRSRVATLAAVVLMAACGGGAEIATSKAQGFVDRMAEAQPTATDTRKKALAAGAIVVNAATAFDWAEYTYPELFPKVPAPQNFTLPYLGVYYTVRGYANGNYLGVTPGNEVYGLGPFTNDQLTLLGSLSQFAGQIQADACSVYPGSCDAARAKELFDWAEYKYPKLFAKGPQDVDVVIDGVGYIERAYPNGNALRLLKGSADPLVHGVGPFAGTDMLALGKWSDFADLVRADACQVDPGSCGGPPPAPTAFSFDEPVPPRLIGFGGAESSKLTGEPGNAANRVVRVDRAADALFYAGTVVGTAADGTMAPIAFAPGRTALTLRVWSPDAGIQVLLKVENADGTKTVETLATVTTAAGWQTLNFDFAEPREALPVLDFRVPYVRLVVFINFGKTGAEAGARTYYFDDLSFTPVAAPPVQGRVGDGIARRAMPASFSTGKAVSYGYVRPSGPTDADLLQDLALMDAAGFNLVRTYIADAVTQRLFTLAASAFPSMRFQLGTGIGGNVCDSTDNLRRRDTAIAQARAHANVVAVSVANEAWELSATCLAGHAAVLRSQITQPITYNDIGLFWVGRWTNGVPDPLLPVIDFASLHTYPFLELGGWDWRQTAVPAGPARAAAMMEAAMVYLKATHAWIARSAFRTSTGTTAYLAASMPIVIGETGWKARETNPANAIEAHAARPVNQKWFGDLVREWETTGGGPKVFYFVAFDETWKGTDDGWGLWDDSRRPRYGLCGLPVPAAPDCNADLYLGAGFFN